MGDYLGERGKALEDSFFAQRDRELLAKLKAAAGAGDLRRALASAIGIDDDEVIDKLVALGIQPEMALAVSMVPLVQVAWADGAIHGGEHEAVMSAATDSGITEGSPAHGLLESWLANKPGDDLIDAWHGYIHALVQDLSEKERAALKDATLQRAHKVAGIAGGILGLGSKFSKSEKAVLEDLAVSFDK